MRFLPAVELSRRPELDPGQRPRDSLSEATNPGPVCNTEISAPLRSWFSKLELFHSLGLAFTCQFVHHGANGEAEIQSSSSSTRRGNSFWSVGM